MFRFCCRRSSLFKKFFDYKDRSVRHGRKSGAPQCKTFFVLRNVTGHYQRIYAKTVFYFLRPNPMNIASITVTGKRVNFGDMQDLQIPCQNLFKGEEKYIEVLKNS